MTYKEKLKLIPEWVEVIVDCWIHNIKEQESIFDMYNECGVLVDRPNIYYEPCSFEEYVEQKEAALHGLPFSIVRTPDN